MVISFHPRLVGDLQLRLPRAGPLGAELRALLRRAWAAVLPQSVSGEHYRAVGSLCPRVFPDYTWRFGPEGEGYEGKAGAAALFARLALPHPRTFRFDSPQALKAHLARHGGLPLPFPLVLKGDGGGGGNWVFLVRDAAGLAAPLERLEVRGWPVVIQEYVEHGGRDCRVVVLGRRLFSYWRRQPAGGEWRTNVGRGAAIDRAGEPRLRRSAEEAVARACRLTGLNLAAFDVIFGPREEPLLLEVNYLFGRKGLPGPYYHLVARAVCEWLAAVEECPVRPAGDKLERKDLEATPWP